MSGDLHQISVAIGELRADAQNSRRSREVTHQKLEAMAAQLEELKAIGDMVAAMKPEVDHYARTRQRAIGGWIVLATGAGGVSWIVQQMFAVLFHKGG